MTIVTIFNPLTDPFPTFDTLAQYGEKIIIINESSVNILITFGNGGTSIVPANDRRMYEFIDQMGIGYGSVTWGIESNTNLSNTFNQVIVENYLESETVPEVYPAPLIRSILGVN